MERRIVVFKDNSEFVACLTCTTLICRMNKDVFAYPANNNFENHSCELHYDCCEDRERVSQEMTIQSWLNNQESKYGTQ